MLQAAGTACAKVLGWKDYFLPTVQMGSTLFSQAWEVRVQEVRMLTQSTVPHSGLGRRLLQTTVPSPHESEFFVALKVLNRLLNRTLIVHSF